MNDNKTLNLHLAQSKVNEKQLIKVGGGGGGGGGGVGGGGGGGRLVGTWMDDQVGYR